MAADVRNFVLFETDLFVLRQRDEDIDAWCVGGDCAGWFYVRLLLTGHIRQQSDPIMEDWGWTFTVSVDGIRVCVSVWAYLEIENCWLFGLAPNVGWFHRPAADDLIAANKRVANAMDAIMAADSRFGKREWFAENPFDLGIKVL